ncbi:MAG: DHH family phosphoesterase [Ruminococcus sp.]|nr:DHH family phosphoesterase [Ruminococcus sp.]
MNRKKFLTLKICLICIFIVTFIMALSIFKYDRVISIIFIIISLTIGAITVTNIISMNKNLYGFFHELSRKTLRVENCALYDYPDMLVIVNNSNQIVWYNKLFLEKFCKSEELFGQSIDEILGCNINPLRKSHHNAIEISIDKQVFKMSSVPYGDYKTDLSMITFLDITELKRTSKLYEQSKPVVMFISIDNFEDIFQNSKESDKANIQAKVEQLIEDFLSDYDSIISRISHDKYTIITKQQYVQHMMDSKFKILDKAREIVTVDRLPLTLSIGVGLDFNTICESEQSAKQALDMALGRGGDQCAIKTSDGSFQFFGGVSKGIEKHSKIKSRIIATAIQELISNFDNVYIMGHRFGDLDSIGSAVGLADAVRQMGKHAYIVTDFERTLAKSLIEHIMSVSEFNMFISVPEALANFKNSSSCLIVVDTHNKDIIESKDLYELANHVIVIDHHRKTVNFINNAVIFHHEPFASSASEMVTELIQYFKIPNKISSYSAEALLSGIMLDTKNFVMKTGVRTFEAAAFLKKNGADTIAVKTLFSTSIYSYKVKASIVASAEIYKRCAIAETDEIVENIRIIAPQSADELLNITGVDASFIIYRTSDCINISARSLGKMNVQLVMEKLGGGGHQTMSATQIHDRSMKDVYLMLISAIDDILPES